MLHGRHVEGETPEEERYTCYKGDGIDPATVRFSPLAAPQGKNPKGQMIPCEMCSLRHACWRSVINYGPMLLAECEQALTPKDKTSRKQRQFNTNEAVLAYVREHPGLTCHGIATGMERSPTHLGEALQRMSDKGLLIRKRGPKGYHYYAAE